MKSYLKANTSGVINGIVVTAKKVAEMKLMHQWMPCAYCVFGSKPFDCSAENVNRPACCGHDKENITRESLYYIKG